MNTLPKMTEFVLGDPAFVSTGVCRLTITRDGEPCTLPVPIKSIGVVEAQEIMEKGRPRPPVTVETIPADSPEGKALGLTEDAVRRVYDYADSQWLAAITAHAEAVTWATVIAGLDVTYKDAFGTVVTDNATIRAGLENSGITKGHLDALVAAIGGLTRASEASARFLSHAPSDVTTKSGARSKSGGVTVQVTPAPPPTTSRKSACS